MRRLVKGFPSWSTLGLMHYCQILTPSSPALPPYSHLQAVLGAVKVGSSPLWLVFLSPSARKASPTHFFHHSLWTTISANRGASLVAGKESGCRKQQNSVKQFYFHEKRKEPSCNAGDPGSIPGSGRSPGKRIGYPFQYSWVFLVAQLLKKLHILARRIPCSPWGHKESDTTEQLSLNANGGDPNCAERF